MHTKIGIETARLIPVDPESQQILETLKQEDIYHQIDSPYTLVNIFLVSTLGGVSRLASAIHEQASAKRNIILSLDSHLEVDTFLGIDSYLCFQESANPCEQLGQFLYMYRNTVEIHGLISFDFNDFMNLVKGRNQISMVSYPYEQKIDEAVQLLQEHKLQDDSNYLLYFTLKHYEPKQLEAVLKPIQVYLESFPADTNYYLDFNEAPEQLVALMKITPEFTTQSIVPDTV